MWKCYFVTYLYTYLPLQEAGAKYEQNGGRTMLRFHADLQQPLCRHVPLTDKAGTMAKKKRHRRNRRQTAGGGRSLSKRADPGGNCQSARHQRYDVSSLAQDARTGVAADARRTMRTFDQSVVGNATSETGSPSPVAQLQLENARLRKLVTAHTYLVPN